MAQTKKREKLRNKVVVPSVWTVAIGFILAIGTVLTICIASYQDLSQKYIDALTDDYARQIENQMNKTMSIAETVSTTVNAIRQRGDGSRQEVLDLVASVLKQHNELVGIGVGFEPNAFDGKDS